MTNMAIDVWRACLIVGDRDCNGGMASNGRWAISTVQSSKWILHCLERWLLEVLENVQSKKFKTNKAIKDGGSTAGLPPNNKQKDHQ